MFARNLPVLGADKVGQGLGLTLVVVGTVVVSVCCKCQYSPYCSKLPGKKRTVAVSIVAVLVVAMLGANVVHLQAVTALGATLEGAVTGHLSESSASESFDLSRKTGYIQQAT